MFLISRFMAWKLATSFVLTAETGLGAEVTRSGDEALLQVSRTARAWRSCNASSGEAVGFSDPMGLAPHHVDDA